MTPRTTRAQRLAMPLARDVVRDLAAEHGACIRPVQLRRTDLHTGQIEQVLVPCGHTLATVCPSCAERAKTLRAAQCREGWHLDTEPVIDPRRPGRRAAHVGRAPRRDTDRNATTPTRPGRTRPSWTSWPPTWTTKSPARACAATSCPARAARRHRSTRRRQDAPDLPRRPVASRDDRQDLHRAGRHDVPAVDVPHPHLRQLRQGRRGRDTRRPGQLRLPAGGPRRAALRRAVRPADPEPAPLRRLRPAVLRRRRTAATTRPARPRRDPRHRVPHRAAAGPRRDLPPGLVALNRRRSGTTTRACPSGTRHPAATSTRPPASSCPPGTTRSTPSATMTSRCTSPGSAPSSTPRASSPDRRTRPAASAT